MTATAAPAGSTPIRRRTQGAVTARFLVRQGLVQLLGVTAVMLVLLTLWYAVARWRGWTIVTETDADGWMFAVTAEPGQVTAVVSLLLVPAGVAVASFVVAIVLAATYTRMMISAGATRASVATGQLAAVLAMTLYLVVLTALALVIGGGAAIIPELLGAQDSGEVGGLAFRGLGTVLLWLVGGVAIATIFLRWPWWVGVGVLVLVFWGVPLLSALVPPVGAVLGSLFAPAVSHLVLAVALALAYWLMVRRVPVP
jgi:hypothetical protein